MKRFTFSNGAGWLGVVDACMHAYHDTHYSCKVEGSQSRIIESIPGCPHVFLVYWSSQSSYHIISQQAIPQNTFHVRLTNNRRENCNDNISRSYDSYSPNCSRENGENKTKRNGTKQHVENKLESILIAECPDYSIY